MARPCALTMLMRVFYTEEKEHQLTWGYYGCFC